MLEIRPPTMKPKTKMNMAAEIHGATKACVGTRIRRDNSRRIIVHRPIQLMAIGGIGVSSAVLSIELMRHLLRYGLVRPQSLQDRPLPSRRRSGNPPWALRARFFR